MSGAPDPTVQQQPQAQPGPTADAPAMAPTSEGLAPEAAGVTEARAAMSQNDPGTFLSEFLASEGLAPEAAPAQPGQQPQVQLAPNGAPAPTPQAPGNAPAPGTTQPVDPALLARLMAGPTAAPAPFAPAPTAWPQQPPAPTAYQPQPAPQPQGQQPPAPNPDDIPVQFAEPFVIPDQMQAGLNHEDPRIRAQAIGAIMAAAGNTVFNRVVTFMRTNDLPAVARATVGRVDHRQMAQTVDRELYGNFPRLRYAAPALIAQAANIVVQEELSRNPNAQVTPAILQRIGQLADAGMTQLAAGGVPNLTPQPAPTYNPGPAPAPVWNGQAWVMPPQAQPAYYPQPQPAPSAWTTGSSAQPFGGPAPAAITPDSEIASFMNGQWGPN